MQLLFAIVVAIVIGCWALAAEPRGYRPPPGSLAARALKR